MDSLTQIVLGAAVGEAVLGKKVGNRAMLWGAIAGTIPDLDVFIKLFTDELTSTELHRGISHSLFFSLLMAPILAWLVHKREKWTLVGFFAVVLIGMAATLHNLTAQLIILAILALLSFLLLRNRREYTPASKWDWTKLFFWSLVTHPLLDAHTTWGTQFFWPFDYRLAYDNIFVVDPLYTIPFLIFLLIALFMKKTNPKRRKFNNAGLIVSSSYMALTFVFKGIGFTHFENSLTSQGIEYVDLNTKPTPLNSFLWNAQVETKTGYRIGYYSIFDDATSITFSREYPKNHHLLDPIKDQKQIKQLLHIAVGWYTVTQKEDHLLFTDLRFGQFGFDQDESPFLWNYKIFIEEDGKVRVVRDQPSFKGGIGAAMSNLATRVTGK